MVTDANNKGEYINTQMNYLNSCSSPDQILENSKPLHPKCQPAKI